MAQPIDLHAINRYREDGYLLAEQLFSPEEVQVMLDHVVSPRVAGTTWDAPDSNGQSARLALWSDLADDVWGAVSTNPRLVNTIRMLQGEDIAFFHGKVILKTAGTGGMFEWHQDYGYWYDQGFVFPRMMSAFVALDACTIANGCLEVLRGSHRLGRLSHMAKGSQTGADAERLAKIKPLFEHVHIEMSPGSVVFFDCQLLHGSAPNLSATHRRSFIICYNALTNPTLEPGHRSPLHQSVPVSSDQAILGFAGTHA